MDLDAALCWSKKDLDLKILHLFRCHILLKQKNYCRILNNLYRCRIVLSKKDLEGS